MITAGEWACFIGNSLSFCSRELPGRTAGHQAGRRVSRFLVKLPVTSDSVAVRSHGDT
jgi:hypothetical protein